MSFGPNQNAPHKTPWNEFRGYEYWGDRLGEDQLSSLEAEEVKKVLKGAKDGTKMGPPWGPLWEKPWKNKPKKEMNVLEIGGFIFINIVAL